MAPWVDRCGFSKPITAMMSNSPMNISTSDTSKDNIVENSFSR